MHIHVYVYTHTYTFRIGPKVGMFPYLELQGSLGVPRGRCLPQGGSVGARLPLFCLGSFSYQTHLPISSLCFHTGFRNLLEIMILVVGAKGANILDPNGQLALLLGGA